MLQMTHLDRVSDTRDRTTTKGARVKNGVECRRTHLLS